MGVQINWTAFLRVNDAESADRLRGRLQEALAREIQVSELGPYWKDDALYRCAFSTTLDRADGPDALIEGLRLAGSVAPSWEIGNLTEPDRLWGWARQGIVIAGIDAIGFEFARYPEPG